MQGKALHLPAQPQAWAWPQLLLQERQACMGLLADGSAAVSFWLLAAQVASMARPASAELQEPDMAALAFHASGSAEGAEQHTVEPA